MADEKMFDQLAAAIDAKRTDARTTTAAIPWADLSTQDKLERLREIVKQLQRTSEWRGRRIEDLASHLAALDEHGHLEGKVCIPVVGAHRHGDVPGETQKNKVEGWFQ